MRIVIQADWLKIIVARVSLKTLKCFVHVTSAFSLAHHYRAVLAWNL
jgi:hypothetical protein